MEATLTRRPLASSSRRAPSAAFGLLAVAGLCLGAGSALAGELSSKPADLVAKLKVRVQAMDARLDGVLGVFVHDLTTGTTVELRPDEVFPTASSIKLAVIYELYRQAEEGRIDLAEVTRPSVPRVQGGGVLQVLGDRVSLTWRDLAVLMMGWSDNEATNVLVRRLGRESVNRRLDSLGLTRTRLRRLMMDIEAARRGDENVSTPREMARLAEIVASGQGLAGDRARDLLAVATIPDEASSRFRRGLPEGMRAVSKPGELEGVRCEAAWVDVPGRPYSAAVMTAYDASEPAAESAITEISAAIYSTFDRLARASEDGRLIGSGK
jgi:beta-lactamase class A